MDDISSNFHVNLTTDVLSDVLQFMGLQGRVFCRATFSAPWALAIPADHMGHFHYVERGICRLHLDGHEKDWTLSGGEIAILPPGVAHLMYDAPGQAPLPISDLMRQSPTGSGCATVRYGGEGDQTQTFCGSFQFRQDREKLLLPLLPEVMVLFCRGSESQSLLESILRFIATESGRQQAGASLVLSRLVEILFVHVLRSWLDSNVDASPASWLSALKDERIATSLSAIHAHPDHPWTVAKLASSSHMSRSPFAARFKQAVGTGPLTYLKQWRMNLATSLLEDSQLSLQEIASRVGYQSETSFSKAYKAITGFSPGKWRQQKAAPAHSGIYIH